LERVGKAGSKFDFEKAKWFNHQYLIRKSDEDIASSFSDILKSKGITAGNEHLIKICSLIKERVNFTSELWSQSFFFFEAPKAFDEKIIKDKWKENSYQLVLEVKDIIANVSFNSATQLKEIASNYIHEKQYNTGQIMNALRICMVGALLGPDLFEIITLLGKDESLKRIDFALQTIK
jgi:glutamyl-tRNA synthetase